jgi:hypothetical protein
MNWSLRKRVNCPDVFGFSSGVVGLLLFKNKKFDAKHWSIDKYLDDDDAFLSSLAPASADR